MPTSQTQIQQYQSLIKPLQFPNALYPIEFPETSYTSEYSQALSVAAREFTLVTSRLWTPFEYRPIILAVPEYEFYGYFPWQFKLICTPHTVRFHGFVIFKSIFLPKIELRHYQFVPWSTRITIRDLQPLLWFIQLFIWLAAVGTICFGWIHDPTYPFPFGTC